MNFKIYAFHGIHRFLSLHLQYTIAASVLTAVATMDGPMTAAGFTLPYWLR